MTTLYENCMLVRLNVSMWSGAITDKALTEDTIKRSGASNDAMRVIKTLVPRSAISPIINCVRAGREEHNRLTVPSFTDGLRILTTEMFPRYQEKQINAKDGFTRTVRAFIGQYEDIIKQAPARMGSAFRREEFPSQEFVNNAFSYTVNFTAMPSATDWRLEGLTNEDADKLRHEMEEDFKAMVIAATKDVYQRIQMHVEKLYEQAVTFEAEGSGKLKEISFENMRELGKIIPALNVANDPALNVIAEDIANYFDYAEAKMVRDSKIARSALADTMQRILERTKQGAA